MRIFFIYCFFNFVFLSNSFAETLKEQNFIEIPMFFHQWEEGCVFANFEEDKINIKAQSIVKWAEKTLSLRGQKIIKDFIDDGLITIKFESKTDSQIIYYCENLQGIVINIPLCERNIIQTEIVPKTKYSVPKTAKIFYPDNLNGYMNIYLSKSFHNKSYNFFYNKSSLYLNTQTMINIKDWILNANAFLKADNGAKQGYQVKRGRVYLIKDFEKKNIRITAGDIANSSVGFLKSIPSFGLQIGNNPVLFKSNNDLSIDENNLYLDAPSEVKIYVNGIYYQTRMLPAGKHQMSNFPINRGLNDVKLIVTDPSGKERTISLNIPYFSEVLRKNNSNYSIFLGFPTYASKKDGFKYQFNDLMYCFTNNFGLSKTTNVGLYSQGNKKQFVFGGQVNNFSKYINTTWDFAFSYLYEISPSFQTRLYFNNYKEMDRLPFNYKFFLGYVGKNYTYFQQYDANKEYIYNPYKFETGLSLSKKIYETNYGLSSYFFKSKKQNQYNQYNISFSASRLILGGRLGVIVNYKAYGNNTNYFQANINFSRKLGKRNHFSSSYNCQTRQLDARINSSYQFSGRRNLQTSLGVATNFNDNKLVGNINYQGSRVNINFNSNQSQVIAYNSDKHQSYVSGFTNLNISTALAFSGGMFSISKPISSGFVIINTEKYNEFPLYINPISGDYDAKTDWILPAVYSIQNYKKNIFSIETQDEISFCYTPAFKTCCCISKNNSGFSIKVPVTKTLFVEGYLYDTESQPIKYGSGFIKSTNNYSKDPGIFFFTDSDGKFSIADLVPGQYQIILENPKCYALTTNISDSKPNTVISLGIIKVKKDDD